MSVGSRPVQAVFEAPELDGPIQRGWHAQNGLMQGEVSCDDGLAL